MCVWVYKYMKWNKTYVNMWKNQNCYSWTFTFYYNGKNAAAYGKSVYIKYAEAQIWRARLCVYVYGHRIWRVKCVLWWWWGYSTLRASSHRFIHSKKCCQQPLAARIYSLAAIDVGRPRLCHTYNGLWFFFPFSSLACAATTPNFLACCFQMAGR